MPLEPRAEGSSRLSAEEETAMKYDVSTGQMEACINRMGGWDNFLRYIGGQGKIVFDTILAFVGTWIAPATTEPFVVSEKFVVDTSRKAKVKISFLGNNFRAWMLGKVEEPG